MCKFFLTNACQRGSLCAYAHSEAEIRAPPNLRCTQLCPMVVAGMGCINADCKFAHDAKQLKSFPGVNLHQAEARNRPDGRKLGLSQASLAAMAAQQAVAAFLVNEGAFVDLEALKHAQAVISQALGSLEDQLKSSSSQAITGSRLAASKNDEVDLEFRWGKFDSDERTTDCASRADELKSCRRESEHMPGGFSRQTSWADMSEDSETTRTTTDLGIAFGRQVSDFGPVFGRQVSYKHELETKCIPVARLSNLPDDVVSTRDSTSLGVKNTFYMLVEDSPPCNSSRRPASVSGRLVSVSSVGESATLGGRLAAKDSQPATKRRMQAMKTKSLASPKLSTQVSGPLQAGLVQARPVLLGRTMAGISMS